MKNKYYLIVFLLTFLISFIIFISIPFAIIHVPIDGFWLFIIFGYSFGMGIIVSESLEEII